jgi:hypothetical protein
MGVLELAEILEDEPDLSRAGQDERDEAAAMLRKQDAAINTLREALEKIAGFDLADESAIVEMARAALAATENL